jgi:hypothetical protein
MNHGNLKSVFVYKTPKTQNDLSDWEIVLFSLANYVAENIKKVFMSARKGC